MPPEPSTPVAPAPSTPAPSTPAPGGDTPSATEAFESQFDLDTAPAPAAPAAPAAPVKPAPTTPAKPSAPAKPAASKPTAPAKPAASPTPEFDEEDGVQVPRYKTDKEFRGWGLKGYKDLKQTKADMVVLQAKYDELNGRVPQTETERKQLAEKLGVIEKAYASLQEEVKFYNYERSPDYKTNYEKPYQDAIARAHRDMGELIVYEEDRSQPADETTGKYPVKERRATPQDFDEVYSQPLGLAARLASKKFGTEAAAIVLQHRKDIRQLGEKAVAALQEWKDKGVQREKDNAAQTVQITERRNSLWAQVNKDIQEKDKDIFGERADDKGWNEALAKGSAMADNYFSDRSAMPMEQKVVFDAHVRNRVAAFPALVYRMRQLEAELAKRDSDLATLKGSAPGKPGVEQVTPPAEESEGALAAFDKTM